MISSDNEIQPDGNRSLFGFLGGAQIGGEKLRMTTTPRIVSNETVFDRVRPVSFMTVSFQVFLPRLARLTGCIDDNAHRRGLESVARVALLRAVRHCYKQVHFGPEIIEVAGAACRLFDLH